MATERRNLYRILHVQPEAPPEIIKASYRALMSTLRGHPDLGGDPEHAAQLNAAYDILSNPEKRRAYDLSLRKRGRPAVAPAASAAPGEPGPAAAFVSDPTRWFADRRCPFCSLAFGSTPSREDRCSRCESPIAPAPKGERTPGEILGRRQGERIVREIDAVLRVPGQRGDHAARLRDLSFNGLSLVCTPRVAKNTPIRVVTVNFDAVALVIACRSNAPLHIIHARLLTLQLLSAGRGAFVSARA